MQGGLVDPELARQHLADESPLELLESRRLSRFAPAILDLQPVGKILDFESRPDEST